MADSETDKARAEALKIRLKSYIQHTTLGYEAFTEPIGLTKQWVTSKSKSIKFENLESIALHYPDLDIQWLIIGKPTDINLIKYPAPLLKEIEQKSIETNILSKGPTMENALKMLDRIISENSKLHDQIESLLAENNDLKLKLQRLGGESIPQKPIEEKKQREAG